MPLAAEPVRCNCPGQPGVHDRDEETCLRTFSEAAQAAGLSYRSAYWWVQRRYIRAGWYSQHGEFLSDGPQGSGTTCYLTADQERVLILTAALVRAGFHVERAAEFAELITHDGYVEVPVCPGLFLSYDPERLQS